MVTFFYKAALRRPLRVSVRVNADSTLDHLTREIGSKVGVDASAIEIIEVFKHKVHKLFEGGHSGVECISPNDVLLAFEVLTPAQVCQ